MQKLRIPLSSFHFGEVSPSMRSRLDTPVYLNSAKTIENMNLLPEGGAAKRAGLERIYDYAITQNTAKTFQSKLRPFIFSDDEKYIVSIEHQKCRVFKIDPTTGDVSLSATLTQDVDTDTLPFDDDWIQEYTTTSYGDVMFICHGLFVPMLLVRTGLDSFEFQKFSFDQKSDGDLIYQPYFNFQASDVTLSAAATTGTDVVITTSVDYFDTTGTPTAGDYLDSLHVGVVLRYGDESELTIKSVQSATSAKADVGNAGAGTLRHRLIIDAIRTLDTQSVVEITHVNHGFAGGESITIEDASAVGGITAANINGSRTVGAIIDDNTYEVTVGAAATSSADGGGAVKIVSGGAITNWSEQCFSARTGYPFAVAFHESRLCFGGTILQPDGIFMSKILEFFNFDVGDADDNDAVQLSVATGSVDAIYHFVSNRDLQIFSHNGEFYVPTFLNQSLTPTNAQFKVQTPYGSTFCNPEPFDGATLFVQNGGAVIREYLFTDQEQAYSSQSVSALAEHLILDPSQCAVVDGAFGNAESYAAFVNNNGELAVFSANRAEKRAGWTRYVTTGTFHSVVAIEDRLFANVWYDTGTTGTPDLDLMLCEFKADFDLDCSKTYTLASGVATVSSEWSNGAVVSMIGDGVYVGTATVSGGTVTVGTQYTEAEIGLAFSPVLTSNPIDISTETGTATGYQRGVSAVVLDLVDTLSVKVETTPVEYTSAYTGKKEVYVHGYSRDPEITITQDKPLALQVNGLIAELIV